MININISKWAVKSCFGVLVIFTVVTGSVGVFKVLGNITREVYAATTPGSCIITLFGLQYDVTSLKNSHSGGDIFVCGTDMTASYQAMHGTNVTRMQPYLITAPTPTPIASPTPVPTVVPTPVPTAMPTPLPTMVPTPTPVPTVTPTPVPTATPIPSLAPSPTPLPDNGSSPIDPSDEEDEDDEWQEEDEDEDDDEEDNDGEDDEQEDAILRRHNHRISRDGDDD